jgi:hypothetical protein
MCFGVQQTQKRRSRVSVNFSQYSHHLVPRMYTGIVRTIVQADAERYQERRRRSRRERLQNGRPERQKGNKHKVGSLLEHLLPALQTSGYRSRRNQSTHTRERERKRERPAEYAEICLQRWKSHRCTSQFTPPKMTESDKCFGNTSTMIAAHTINQSHLRLLFLEQIARNI